MGGKSSSPPPPDYTPMATASVDVAKISAELGREQLAENKRQYELNMATAKPIIDTQSKASQLAFEQGKENYETFKTEGRPLQKTMRDIAEGKLSPEVQAQMETQAGRNVADVAASLDAQRTSTSRTMARMGINPNSGKTAAANAEMDLSAAAIKAGGANAGRTSALDKVYARTGDTFNTYSGLGSSAPTFYGASTNAGNSAVGNQNQTAAQYINGMNAGNNTIMGGQQLRVQALGSILNSQASVYNASNNNNSEMMGTIIGGGLSLATKFSDRRLKESITLVGKDEATGLNLYEFEYINGDGTRFQGVMADEVQALYPKAVVYDDLGFASVNYAMLGIELKEVA
jgi:hypothetical protein